MKSMTCQPGYVFSSKEKEILLYSVLPFVETMIPLYTEIAKLSICQDFRRSLKWHHPHVEKYAGLARGLLPGRRVQSPR